MLIELRLANLAVVREARLELADGLNVLTGSTGAGKSLVIEALRWLCGERIDHGLLRPGAQSAHAEAIFDLRARPDRMEALRNIGVDVASDGLLRLRRELRPGGRSRAFLGAELTTANVLAAVMAQLVSVQSQHQQLALLDPGQHVRLLDACGTQPELVELYGTALKRQRESERHIEEWQSRRQRFLGEREFLAFQCQELEGAALLDGEMPTLRERVSRLSGGARLLRALATAQSALADEEGGALAALYRAQSALEAERNTLAECSEWSEQLANATVLAQEVERQIGRVLDAEPEDPAELDRLQERLHGLEGLCRKYARTESELIALRQRLRAELDGLGMGNELPAEMQAEADQALAELSRHADALRRARRQVARRVPTAAAPLLERLGMPGAVIEFELTPRSEKGSALKVAGEAVRAHVDGTDAVRLLVRTNRGSALAPVERVASGGELSRIGLVLRCLSTLVARPLLLILDEVDSGLGADLGPALAKTLDELAQGEQVLVITHLPAVAAMASCHFVVRKDPGQEQAVAALQRVERREREQEIARMLGGGGQQELQLARRLLAAASSTS